MIKNYKICDLFTNCGVLNDFPFPIDDFDSLTQYEMLIKCINHIKKLYVNDETLTNRINALANYLENLDLQDEVNNKIDEMVESGQLQEIITEYLQINGVLGYDTVSNMVSATNIIDGSICRTLGLNTYNDGKGTFYKVRTITSGDVVDGVNIIALNVSDTLIAEKISNYYLNQEITNRENADNVLDEKINTESKEVNLMNNITYDLPSAYSDWYSQGSVVDGNTLYVYIEKNESGKLLEFNHTTYSYVGEHNVDLKHGGDLTIINNKMYVASFYDKNIIVVDLNDYTTSTISVNVDEERISGIAKIDNDNLLLLSSGSNTANYSGIGFYNYNLTTSTLSKLSFNTNNVIVNFYAIQALTYKDGYIYQLVSNPNQIIKLKLENNEVKIISIYKLPVKDNLGLLIGEYEGISIINGDNMMITSHILDDALTTRTIKSYVINLVNGVPSFPVYYPNIYNIESNSQYQLNVYLDKGSSSLLELGTQSFPFKSLARALGYCYSKDMCSIILTNSTNTNLEYKISNINNFNGAINILANKIKLGFQRILNSNIQIDDTEAPTNTDSYVELINWAGAVNYNNILNSNVKLFCNYHSSNTLFIAKSNFIDNSKVTTNISANNPIWRIRRDTMFICNTDWSNSNTNGNDLYFICHDGAILHLPRLLSNASSWISSHVSTLSSISYSIISGGLK